MENDRVKACWSALAQSSSEPNPYYEPWYLLPALNALAPRGVRLLCFELGGDLAGLMPLAAPFSYYGRPIPHLAAWTHPNGFLGAPLVARGFEREFWRTLLAYVDARAGAALFLHLADLPLSGPLAEALRAVLAEQDRPHALVWREERAALSSSLSPEAYLEASLSGKKRKELRRQHARLSELGTLTTLRQHDENGLERWIEDFLRLEASGWKGAAGSALMCQDATADLFRRALAGAARAGKLERLAMMLDGRPVAMLASFLCPPLAFTHKTAFDESLSRFSPGVLLQRDNLAILSNQQIALTDSCASANHPMIDHIWRERRSVGRISIAIGGAVRRALFAQIVKREQQVEW